MKNKWLIGALSCVMATAFCVGLAACNDDEKKTGPSDEEIAQSGITMLNGIYLDSEGKVKDYETPEDYLILSQTKVGDDFYAVNWSVTSETENIGQYVKIGTEADASARYTVDITRATFDIEYTLTASITVGKVTKTADYGHKIPKKSSEDATTASISFDSTANRTSYSTEQQVWKNIDGTLIFTNNKANSTSDVGDYSSPVRIYQGSTVEIEFPGLTTVVFHSATNEPETFNKPKPLYDYLKANLEASFPDDTVTADDENSTVTLTLSSPVSFISFTASKQLRLYSIDVEGTEGGATDAQKVAAVKAWLTVSQTSFNSKTTVALATEKAGTTIAWSLKAASEYVKVENGTLTIENLPDSGEEQVILVATISAGATEKDTKEFTLTLTPEAKLENDGTAEHPYTVAEVYQLASTLASGSVYQKDGKSVSMHVKGVITAEGSWKSEYSNWQDVIIADSASGTQKLKLYGLNPGAGLSETNAPKVGGTIVVVGALKNYDGTIELTFDGSIKLNTVEYTAPVDERTPQQKVADALSDLSDTFIVTKAGETELPASTEKDVTFTWATEDKTYTITGNKINVASLPAEDVTVTATVTATCGTEAVTNNTKTVTITIKAKGEEPAPGSGDGTVDHPYSVAEATEIIAGLGTETVYKVNGEIALVYVKGIVTVKGTTDSYGIKNYFMADVAGDTENDISVYSLNWGTVKQGTEINVGDTIIVTGYLQNFNGTYEVSSYKDTSWHNGTVEAHTPVGGTVTPPTPSDADATLSFATETARQSQTKEEQVWLANGITFTNTKSKSVNDVANFVNPVRCYPSSIVKIEFTSNITKIVFYSEANDTQDTKASKQYFDSLKESLEACEGVTVTVDAEKTTVTVVLTTPASSFEFTATRQVRFYSIDVYAGGGTTTPKTDAEKLAEAKAALKLSKTELTSLDDEVALPATQGEASVTYELQGTTDLVKIEGGKLIVLKLPETDTEIVIKATLTVGQETDNVDLKVTILAPEPFSPITAPAAGSDYYMGMKAQDGEYHYLTGAMTGYYMATTTDIESAKKVTLAGSNDAGWTMVLDGKYIEIELSGTHVNAVYKTSQTAGSVWKWDSQYNIFTMEISGSKYFLGTNGSYTTVGGGDYSKYVASNWLAVLGTYGKGGTVDPTPDPDPEPDPDVHDDEKYGSAAAPLSVEEALALAAEECTSLSSWTKQIVYMTGKITAIGDRKQGSNNSEYYPNVYLQDLTNSQKVILVYSLNLSTKETILGQNDTVVMSGYITLFGYSEPGTIEFSGKDDVHPTVLNCTRGESEISTEVTGATISGLPSTNKAVNGTEISFTIQADAGKKIASVKAYDKEIEATEGTYKFTLNGNVTIKVETIGENEKAAEEIASLGFADATAKAGDTSVGSYTSEWEATRGSYTWVINNFNNNRNGWNFIKTGHKTSAVVGTITTKAALAAKISKVIVTIDSTSKNYMADNVNSFKLQIADTNEFTNPTEISLNIKTGENEFVIDTPAANKFYRIVIDCKTNVSDNGFVVLSSVSYWGTTD